MFASGNESKGCVCSFSLSRLGALPVMETGRQSLPSHPWEDGSDPQQVLGGLRGSHGSSLCLCPWPLGLLIQFS